MKDILVEGRKGLIWEEQEGRDSILVLRCKGFWEGFRKLVLLYSNWEDEVIRGSFKSIIDYVFHSTRFHSY